MTTLLTLPHSAIELPLSKSQHFRLLQYPSGVKEGGRETGLGAAAEVDIIEVGC